MPPLRQVPAGAQHVTLRGLPRGPEPADLALGVLVRAGAELDLYPPLLSRLVVRRGYHRLLDALVKHYFRVRAPRKAARAFWRMSARAKIAGDDRIRVAARAMGKAWDTAARDPHLKLWARRMTQRAKTFNL